MVALTQLPAQETSPDFRALVKVRSLASSPAPSTASGSGSRDASPGSDQEPWTISLCSLLSTPAQAAPTAPQHSVAATAPRPEVVGARAQWLAEVTAELRRTAEAEAEQKFLAAWHRCEGVYEGIAREQAKRQEELEQQLQVVLGTQTKVAKENQVLRQTIQLLASRLDHALESGTLQQRAAHSSGDPRRELGLVCHTVLLGRSEGQSLGLDLAPSSDQRCLEVARLLPGGAAEIWNRQAATQSQRILCGDRLVSVNGVATADAMVQELRLKRMLKIKLQRGGDRHVEPAQRGIA